MLIKLISVGKIKEKYYRDRIETMIKDFNKSSKNSVTIIEVPDESIPQNAGEAVNEMIKEKEGKRILSKISNKDYVAALCIEGQPTDNKKLEALYQKARDNYASSFVLVIGGSLGLSDEVIKRADTGISISNMTFPHQLVRVLILEIICDSLCDC